MKTLATLLFASTLAAGEALRPNVVFILADDLGWGDLGCQGHPTLRTPVIDRLAAEGIRCTQYSVASPVCSPSRAALLTGRRPAALRFHWVLADSKLNAWRTVPDQLDPQVPTLARTLHDAGYATAHVGKWHLGDAVTPRDRDAYGFDHHDVPSDRAWNLLSADEAASRDKAVQGLATMRSSAAIVDRASAWIASVPATQPFYVQLWMRVPHSPLGATPEQIAPFAELVVDPKASAFGFWQQDYYHRLGRNRDEQARIYHAAVSDLDAQIGRLLAQLEQLGRARDTIVIFSSDNGPEHAAGHNAGTGSAGTLRGRKHGIYEGGLRTPWIVRYPARIPAGTVDETSVLNGIDLHPTVAALCGVPAPAGIDGEDRSAVWLGTPTPRRDPLCFEFMFCTNGSAQEKSPPLAIRDGPWKLLTDYAGTRSELYDLAADPDERHDRSAAEPDRAAALRERLLAWVASLPPTPIRTSWTKPIGFRP
jgi:N-acetylgalactosamine-6-sulfatase